MGDLALTEGKCESCGKRDRLFRFRNEYTEPEINFNLCMDCTMVAVKCMAFFFTTPAGKKAIARKQASA